MSPIRLTLEPQYERRWSGENPSPATFQTELDQFPLYHQWRTYNVTEPLIINTYNTGTGKTKAALLRLLKRARDIGFNYPDSSEHNALLIAPTSDGLNLRQLLTMNLGKRSRYLHLPRYIWRSIALTN